jgi:hypothetical protein
VNFVLELKLYKLGSCGMGLKLEGATLNLPSTNFQVGLEWGWDISRIL